MLYLIDFSKPRKIRKDKYLKRKPSRSNAKRVEAIKYDNDFQERKEKRKILSESSREARSWLSLGSRIYRYTTM